MVWSSVYIDPFTHVQMITASSPYYVEEAFAGVATIDISLDNLIKFVAKNAEQYELGVVLRDGYGDVITEHNFQMSENIYISQHAFGDFNWSVDVVNAKRLVAEQVYDLVTKVELGLIPIMLTFVMFGYFLINRFLINPVVLISEKVGDSKTGGIIDISYSSDDEIRYLIDVFNQKTVYLEAEKVKAQASTKAKSAFLATLSHEIRTPMNGVLGTAQILLKSKLDDEQRKHLKTLYDSGDHMMTLLNEILDFSKIEQGHLELEKAPFPLDSIIGSVNSVYHTLCVEKGLQFKVISEIPADRWYNSDKARLRQILFNLLNNAVKFTSHGYVEVYFRERQVEGSTVLSIQVRDTGIGIAKEKQSKIFNPFEQAESSTTRKYGGTGLGLAIVKQISQLMQGDVKVTSELGIGTSFDVEVEMEISTGGEVVVKERKKLNFNGLKVLIVEDNRTNAIIMSTFMNNKGFHCDSVENGELALAKIQQEHYDLVLMDNHMPVMDGVEATLAMRNLPSVKARVLIFGCTADVFKETRERMISAGVDYIIAKPIDENELDDALFQYAAKLYQYHPEMSHGSSFDFNLEQELIALYVAIESKDLQKAEGIVNEIMHQLPLNERPDLKAIFQTLKTDLAQRVQPDIGELDILTVLLKDFCR